MYLNTVRLLMIGLLEKQWKIPCRCCCIQAHKSRIVGMDWSLEPHGDVYLIRTSSMEGDLLFCTYEIIDILRCLAPLSLMIQYTCCLISSGNSETGEQKKNISEIKSIKWLSHNVTVSAGVLGMLGKSDRIIYQYLHRHHGAIIRYIVFFI